MAAVFDIPAHDMAGKKQRPVKCVKGKILVVYVIVFFCLLLCLLKDLHCLILGLTHVIEKVDWLEECVELPGLTCHLLLLIPLSMANGTNTILYSALNIGASEYRDNLKVMGGRSRGGRFDRGGRGRGGGRRGRGWGSRGRGGRC